MEMATGQVLQNRYRIVKLLGQGGFGAVYRAWDTSLSRPCALKENLDTSLKAQKQFEREAKILANLDHPNLPRVTDHFFIEGQGQYLVMDFVEGQDLGEMLQRTGEPVTESGALSWIIQVCDALVYLHGQNPPVIHRDVKPANIKITPGGTAKLVDFGIAKIFDPGLSTTVGARAVTPGFSPPEQYGHGITDARTDVYALGATLYCLLTAQVPPESVMRTAGTPLDPPRALNPSISTGADRAIQQAMQLAPERRYQRVIEFKDALAGLPIAQGEPVHVAPQRRAPAVRLAQASDSTPRRKFPWIWMAGVVGVCLVGLVCLFGLALIGETSETPPSQPLSQASKPPASVGMEETPPGVAVSTPTNSKLPTASPVPEPVVQLLDGDARQFADPPSLVAYANIEFENPPSAVTIRDGGGLWRYHQWVALMDAGHWIEAKVDDPEIEAVGVQFWGDTNDGWARVLLDGEEVWRGSIYGTGVGEGEMFTGYVEIANLGPGPHTLRIEALGQPGEGGGDDVSIFFFGTR